MLGHSALLLLITLLQLRVPVPKVLYNAYTTAETAELVSCVGVVKGDMQLDKNFFDCLRWLSALLSMRDIHQQS
jgi:hypothetical protein